MIGESRTCLNNPRKGEGVGECFFVNALRACDINEGSRLSTWDRAMESALDWVQSDQVFRSGLNV